jgi:hypothetical protein
MPRDEAHPRRLSCPPFRRPRAQGSPMTPSHGNDRGSRCRLPLPRQCLVGPRGRSPQKQGNESEERRHEDAQQKGTHETGRRPVSPDRHDQAKQKIDGDGDQEHRLGPARGSRHVGGLPLGAGHRLPARRRRLRRNLLPALRHVAEILAIGAGIEIDEGAAGFEMLREDLAYGVGEGAQRDAGAGNADRRAQAGNERHHARGARSSRAAGRASS